MTPPTPSPTRSVWETDTVSVNSNLFYNKDFFFPLHFVRHEVNVLMSCWFCWDLMIQMDAFRMALDAWVDCVEVDVSRSSDGVLFALHDR